MFSCLPFVCMHALQYTNTRMKRIHVLQNSVDALHPKGLSFSETMEPSSRFSVFEFRSTRRNPRATEKKRLDEKRGRETNAKQELFMCSDSSCIEFVFLCNLIDCQSLDSVFISALANSSCPTCSRIESLRLCHRSQMQSLVILLLLLLSHKSNNNSYE